VGHNNHISPFVFLPFFLFRLIEKESIFLVRDPAVIAFKKIEAFARNFVRLKPPIFQSLQQEQTASNTFLGAHRPQPAPQRAPRAFISTPPRAERRRLNANLATRCLRTTQNDKKIAAIVDNGRQDGKPSRNLRPYWHWGPLRRWDVIEALHSHEQDGALNRAAVDTVMASKNQEQRSAERAFSPVVCSMQGSSNCRSQATGRRQRR
jgi:hypothetical protein